MDTEKERGTVFPPSIRRSAAPEWWSSQVLHAQLAAADAAELLAGLQRLRVGLRLEGLVHRGQPEAVLGCKVMAGALGPVALDERRGAEVLQTGPGRGEGLAAAFIASRRVLGDGTKRGQRKAFSLLLVRQSVVRERPSACC